VQRLSYQFFSSTGGATDQRDTVMRGDTADARKYLQHLGAAAGHAMKAVAFEKLIIEFQGLAAQAAFVQ
jgi:hypothetical protein